MGYLDRPRTEVQIKIDRRAGIIAAIVAIGMLVLLILVVIFLAQDPLRTANIRDIVIILSAFGVLVMSIVVGVLLVVLIYRLQDLISFLRSDIVPMLADIQTTLSTVRGTTTFVSDNVAKPTIKVASFVAGIQQMARSANTRVRGRNTGSYTPPPGTFDQGEDYVAK